MANLPLTDASPSSQEALTTDAWKTLRAFSIHDQPPMYVIGAFDVGVTALHQQVRALNLACAMIEADRFHEKVRPVRVAVIGAGLAGLTFAAALLKKEVNCEVTLFEEHDTLMPLQQGSDTRWLHPHIYDWPEEGSQTDVAMLPLLNWSAARASDVVVQILEDWRQVVEKQRGRVRLFCNARHLQVDRSETDVSQARVEWVGERRSPADGTGLDGLDDEDGDAGPGSDAQGRAEVFDEVVFAVGFGIEAGRPSYWRNENMGQPSLHQRRQTHLISGQGDGALIDLFRVRISQYRQDRILEEMFEGADNLVAKLRALKARFDGVSTTTNLFDRFDELFGERSAHQEEAERILHRLARRLRRDTDALLQLYKIREIAKLLEPKTSRTSFQNKLLVYLLYRVGGFAPSVESEEELCRRYAIPSDQVVRRHGTKKGLPQLQRILSESLFDAIRKKSEAISGFATQRAVVLWPGGYFSYKGRYVDKEGGDFRLEYLPGPTKLVAATICGAIVGVLNTIRPQLQHVRVTLHRVMPLGKELLLQQACDYQGKGFQPEPTAGRTFPVTNAMIGLAWACQRPVHTKPGISKVQMQRAMDVLNLHAAARRMLPDVSYVLAMPILQADASSPGRVVAVLYLDSKDQKFALSDQEIDRVSAVVRAAFEAIKVPAFAGVRNNQFRDGHTSALPTPPVDSIEDAVKVLDADRAPVIDGAFALNLDRIDPASFKASKGWPGAGGDA